MQPQRSDEHVEAAQREEGHDKDRSLWVGDRARIHFQLMLLGELRHSFLVKLILTYRLRLKTLI